MGVQIIQVMKDHSGDAHGDDWGFLSLGNTTAGGISWDNFCHL